ncbi:MAG: hypothetical protein WBB72_03250 [Methyloceanibacter sp.]|uniref:hypothetical protein n=1 Tax=Methyloceanibacter sp. TaxID=1965321 RepID=UPI003C706A15
MLDDGVDAPAPPRRQEIVLDQALYAVRGRGPAAGDNVAAQPLLDHCLEGKRRRLTVSP